MTKSKSTRAGRMAVLDFLREEGIQIVPVPHGDRKTGGQIVVMLGDGTWLEFDTQKQVVDWLAEHMERRGVKVHNPSKSRTTSKYPYVYGIRPLGSGWQGYARLGLKSAEITSALQPSREAAAEWLFLLLRERGLNKLVWAHEDEVKLTQHGWDTELRKGLGMSDLAAAKPASRRNPSAQSVSANKKYWWLVVAREDGYANVTSHDTRNQMIAESTVQIQATKRDPGAVVIRGNVAMTRKQFREGFQTAYPKLHILEV